MAEILRYVIVDANDVEDDHEYERLDLAREGVPDEGGPWAIVERVYTYDDSSLVWTSTGADTWPPGPRKPDAVCHYCEEPVQPIVGGDDEGQALATIADNDPWCPVSGGGHLVD